MILELEVSILVKNKTVHWVIPWHVLWIVSRLLAPFLFNPFTIVLQYSYFQVLLKDCYLIQDLVLQLLIFILEFFPSKIFSIGHFFSWVVWWMVIHFLHYALSFMAFPDLAPDLVATGFAPNLLLGTSLIWGILLLSLIWLAFIMHVLKHQGPGWRWHGTVLHLRQCVGL